MQRTGTLMALLLSGVLALGGCVTSGTFEKKVQEAQTLESNLQTLKQQYADLTKENQGLKAQVTRLAAEGAALAKEKELLTGQRDTLIGEKERLARKNSELQSDLSAKADTLSKNIAELRQKNTTLENDNLKLQDTVTSLEKDNARLKGEIAVLQRVKEEEVQKGLKLQDTVASLEKDNAGLKGEIAVLQRVKEEEVQKASKTYQELLEKMKGEISKGEVTISELKGKLTVNMIDAILFDSGKAEVKPEGLTVLQKVIDILKGVKDKMIRVEGHTDNQQIHGALAKRFPTNWELSAARSINVARYLQERGIDPNLLAAIAYGEFRPVASNNTEEGRAKNRRIEIILVPKE